MKADGGWSGTWLTDHGGEVPAPALFFFVLLPIIFPYIGQGWQQPHSLTHFYHSRKRHSLQHHSGWGHDGSEMQRVLRLQFAAAGLLQLLTSPWARPANLLIPSARSTGTSVSASTAIAGWEGELE